MRPPVLQMVGVRPLRASPASAPGLGLSPTAPRCWPTHRVAFTIAGTSVPALVKGNLDIDRKIEGFGARQTQCVGLHDGKPKIQLKAPPVDGAANQALIAFLSTVCGVPKSAICIESGAASRTKRVAIRGLSDEDISRLLAAVS